MPASFTVDAGAPGGTDEQATQSRLQEFARSTRVRIDPTGSRLSLEGADLFYHAADSTLVPSLAAFMPAIQADSLGNYHARLALFDLCLEDSWTGKFVAQAVRAVDIRERLTILHLDDHTDMMPTLLSVESGQSTATDGPRRFDPTNPADWDDAIRSGSIGIGSFMTALYDLPLDLDVRHLCHDPASNRHTLSVIAATQRHALLHSVEFSAVDRITGPCAARLGTYTASTRAADLLGPSSDGPMIVHVDLDYFINDFNGNVGQRPLASVEELQARARRLLDDLFDALRASGARVERWIIATSPGFCAARHWPMLLSELSQRIADVR